MTWQEVVLVVFAGIVGIAVVGGVVSLLVWRAWLKRVDRMQSLVLEEMERLPQLPTHSLNIGHHHLPVIRSPLETK